jgi:hypothetical protein
MRRRTFGSHDFGPGRQVGLSVKSRSGDPLLSRRVVGLRSPIATVGAAISTWCGVEIIFQYPTLHDTGGFAVPPFEHRATASPARNGLQSDRVLKFQRSQFLLRHKVP